MKLSYSLTLLLAGVAPFACAADVAVPSAAAPTPAELSIQKAQAQIAKQPDHVPFHNQLAMAYARRARETSDVQYYEKAENELKLSFQLAPDDFEARKVQTWLLLGRHEFAKAREAALALNKQKPDDVTVYGYLADANAELGNYDQAVEAVQWMLNLRPGNVAGLTRAAYLRELHGDIAGAAELMQMAYDSTPYQQSEDRAWLLTQLSHLQLLAGDLPEAERFAQAALSLFPKYHYALAALAQVRIVQQRFDDAAALLEQRYAAAPHAENLFALAQAETLAGRVSQADSHFKEFERQSLRESAIGDNSNHELMAYYTDFAHQSNKALEIAQRELIRRRDVHTLDGYAWALAGTGAYKQAELEMQKAMAWGVQDPVILYHAAMIAQALHHDSQTRQLLSSAASRGSVDAARQLAQLN